MKYYNDVVKSLPPLTGKCVAITGTTSGIGYWAAVATARKGPACLLMLNRISSRAVAAEEEVKREAPAGVDVITIACDLENITSIHEAAAAVNRVAAKYGGLDVVALNGGIMSQPDVRTMDGFDVMMQTDHLGHFLLTKLLMPSLAAAASSRGECRIVEESSLARGSSHILEGGGPLKATYFPRSPAGSLGGNASAASRERYHQAQLAKLAFSMALHSKLKLARNYSNFKSVASAPGFSDTHLDLPKFLRPDWIKNLIGMSAADGSCSILTAMFAPSVKSGDFHEPRFLSEGLPMKVIAEGTPLPPALPRGLPGVGIHDAEICADETLAKVWEASEDALGLKWVIGVPSLVFV